MVVLLMLAVCTASENNAGAEALPVQVNGVFPNLTVMAKGIGSDSEAGIGALIPWAEKLWAVGYVAHIRGEGLGLYEISEDMTMRRHPASVTGTFANRTVHWPSGQAFIGPHAIDAEGNVRTIESLKNYRLTATVTHLTDPNNKVYFLGMEGRFWEVDVRSLESKLLFNLVNELEINDATPHFKGAYTAQGRVVVANNTYDEKEFLGQRDAGRLAEWDGDLTQSLTHLRSARALAQEIGLPGEEWSILSAQSALYAQQGDRDQAQRTRDAAGAILISLADSINQAQMRSDFLASGPVREILEPEGY